MKLVICNCSAIFIVRQFHRQNNMCARCCCFLDYDFNETWEPKRIYDVEILSKIISKETISVSNIRCQRLLLTSQMNCSFQEKKKLKFVEIMRPKNEYIFWGRRVLKGEKLRTNGFDYIVSVPPIHRPQILSYLTDVSKSK